MMEEHKQYKLLRDVRVTESLYGGSRWAPKGEIVTHVGVIGAFVAIQTCAIYGPLRYHALARLADLEEILPTPAPVDRAAWRDGIEQVMGYLPAMNDWSWSSIKAYDKPLYDGLRKMQENGPDND